MRVSEEDTAVYNIIFITLENKYIWVIFYLAYEYMNSYSS